MIIVWGLAYLYTNWIFREKKGFESIYKTNLKKKHDKRIQKCLLVDTREWIRWIQMYSH